MTLSPKPSFGFSTMYELELFNSNNRRYFFEPKSKRYFNSRIQTTPPHAGRVFVTSEKHSSDNHRRYSVRMIQPDGGIDTIKPDPTRGGFCYFSNRRSAQAFAKEAAAEMSTQGDEWWSYRGR